MPIKFILFDWGGTLAKTKTRKDFIHKKKFHEKIGTLKHDTLYTLQGLKEIGIGMGIISNMSKSPKLMNKALKETGMDQFFDIILFSNEKDHCAKPCKGIFEKAINYTGLHPSEILYVGNSYLNDILGPKKLGMKTAFLRNKNDLVSAAIEQYGHQDYFLYQLSELVDF